MVFANTSNVFQNFFCEQRARTHFRKYNWRTENTIILHVGLFVRVGQVPRPRNFAITSVTLPGRPRRRELNFTLDILCGHCDCSRFYMIYSQFLFNENPNMRATAKILRVRAGEHSSKFCEQIEQRPKNFYDHSMVPAFDKP